MPNAFAAADYVSSSATILSGAPSTDSLLMPLHPHPPTKSLSALATDFLVCVEQSFPQLSSVGFQRYGLDWPCRMRRKTYRKYPWSLNIDIFLDRFLIDAAAPIRPWARLSFVFAAESI